MTTIEIWSKKTGVGLVLVSLVHPFPPTGRNQLNVDCHSLSSVQVCFWVPRKRLAVFPNNGAVGAGQFAAAAVCAQNLFISCSVYCSWPYIVQHRELNQAHCKDVVCSQSLCVIMLGFKLSGSTIERRWVQSSFSSVLLSNSQLMNLTASAVFLQGIEKWSFVEQIVMGAPQRPKPHVGAKCWTLIVIEARQRWQR